MAYQSPADAPAENASDLKQAILAWGCLADREQHRLEARNNAGPRDKQ